MIRYGLKSHMQIIASHFHFKAVMYMVAFFLSPVQVAYYSIASRLAEHIMWLPQSLGLALFPRMAGSSEQRAHDMTGARLPPDAVSDGDRRRCGRPGSASG